MGIKAHHTHNEIRIKKQSKGAESICTNIIDLLFLIECISRPFYARPDGEVSWNLLTVLNVYFLDATEFTTDRKQDAIVNDDQDVLLNNSAKTYDPQLCSLCVCVSLISLCSALSSLSSVCACVCCVLCVCLCLCLSVSLLSLWRIRSECN